MIMHTNCGQYDNILQFTKKADLIIRGLSDRPDALHYNDHEWGGHPERLRIYILSPGWITGLLEMRHVPFKYSGSLSADSCTQTVIAMSGATNYASTTNHTINLVLS